MPNMSYCRFRNTLTDLRDCYEVLDEMSDPEKELEPEEFRAFKRLLAVCRNMADAFDGQYED
jgi:hypothetical protein